MCNKSTGLNPFCMVKQIKYAGARCLFGTVGRMSKGIQIGWKYGFDSGESLDYVYENQARGVGPVGTLLDRAYLDSAGWRGIRTRGQQIKEAIKWAIIKTDQFEDSIELIDIAAGPGRYVLDVLRSAPNPKVHARLYDLDEKGLEFGRTRAWQLGVYNVEFKRRDAFAPDTPEETKVKANIAIASGLYELFSNNTMVSRSLAILSDRVADGGYLIYTNQPWHPQLEFISEVLTNRHGEKWVMRCRTQEEMDALVEGVGFEKISQTTDERGIFTVSIARKRGAALSELHDKTADKKKQDKIA